MKSNEQLSCIIIGLGSIGMMYDYEDSKQVLTHANAIHLSPYFKLIAGIDNDQGRRMMFRDRYKAQAYPSIDEAKELRGVDLVVVATPSKSHISDIRRAIEVLDPVSLLCEKPLGLSYIEAMRLFNDEVPLKLREKTFVNYIRRADPSSMEILAIVKKQRTMQSEIKGYCFYTKGAFNTASHFLDLLQFWFGPCQDITCLKSTPAMHDVEDVNADFIAKFGGANIVFQAGDDNNYIHYGIELYLDCGRLRYDHGGLDITFFESEGNAKINQDCTIIKNDLSFYQRNVYSEIHKALEGGMHSLTTVKEALYTLECLDLLKARGRQWLVS